MPFWDRLSARLFAAEPYAIESFLALISIWGAWALFHPPSNFAAYRGAYLWISSIDSVEEHWASLLVLNAALTVSGLVLCLVFRRHSLGLTARLGGLAISGFFWTLLGLSTLLGNIDTLLGFPVFLIGVSAWVVLLRFPTMPSSGHSP